MSDSGLVSAWQRALRDDPRPSELLWKIGMALSTFADQYTDETKGFIAGHHARPGVIRLSRAAHVSRDNIEAPLKELIGLGYIEKTGESNRRTGKTDEYRLIPQPDPVCP